MSSKSQDQQKLCFKDNKSANTFLRKRTLHFFAQTTEIHFKLLEIKDMLEFKRRRKRARIRRRMGKRSRRRKRRRRRRGRKTRRRGEGGGEGVRVAVDKFMRDCLRLALQWLSSIS